MSSRGQLNASAIQRELDATLETATIHDAEAQEANIPSPFDDTWTKQNANRIVDDPYAQHPGVYGEPNSSGLEGHGGGLF